MMPQGLQVICSRGIPATASADALEIDVGVALPTAFSGLRIVLARLREAAPAAIDAIARAGAAEWNELFPATFPDAPVLAAIANTPSERRLHRESEQVFRVLQLAAQALLAGLAAIEQPLVLRNTYACDLVSLRGLLRAAEWSRLLPQHGQLILAEWDGARPHLSAAVNADLRAYRDQIRTRLAAPLLDAPAELQLQEAAAPQSREERFVQLLMCSTEPPARRLAAALALVRSCFFSTNYEGSFLAAEQGLRLLDQAEVLVAPGAVAAAWSELEQDAEVLLAIELDAERIGDGSDLRALLWQAIGVSYALMGLTRRAMTAFGQGLSVARLPVSSARLHMFRALLLVKRCDEPAAAQVEVAQGLDELRADPTPTSLLEQAWLRNVLALTYHRQGRPEQAMAEVKGAIKSLAQLHSGSATHLKINLISNVSSLLEASQRYSEAISVWDRFSTISSEWGDTFLKHYRYRAGGLALRAQRLSDAERAFEDSYQCSARQHDLFHLQAIAAELGRAGLDQDDPNRAMLWFSRAVMHAEALGDSLRLGESLIGLALAKGETSFESALAIMQTTLTYPEQVARWQAAINGDASPTALIALLPALRTKLNRPFDTVNIDLQGVV